MKYLAMILAVLTVEPTMGAGLYKYVPESVEIRFTYVKTGTGETLSKVYSVDPNSAQAKFEFEDKPDQRTNILPDRMYGSMSVPNVTTYELGPIKGFSSLRTNFNSTYFVKAGSTDLRDVSRQPVGYAQSTLTDRWVPAASESSAQYMTGECGVPEYIMSDAFLQTADWGVEMNMTQSGLGNYETPRARMECIIKYRRIIEPKIEIQTPTMNITALSGTNEKYMNTIHVTAANTPTVLTIVNPNQHELSVSFSETDDTATTTNTPAVSSSSNDIYVGFKNQHPGSRTYAVTITAECI